MAIIATDEGIAGLLRRVHTIAIVGLSDKQHRDSHRVGLYLQGCGYTIIPVNPKLSVVLGEPSFPDIEGIGYPVDLVDVFRRPEFMPGIVDAAIRAGARSLWMQPDTVHEGAVATAAAAGLDVVIDGCIMVEHRRLLS